MRILTIFCVIFLGLAIGISADEGGSNADDTSFRKFAGFSFGPAIAVLDFSKYNGFSSEAVLVPVGTVDIPILNLSLPNTNMLLVTKESKIQQRIMLETHYYWGGFADQGDNKGKIYGYFGFGPFVALGLGSENVIETYGGGLMIGFKRNSTDKTGFNIGIGRVAMPNARIFQDGLLKLPLFPTLVPSYITKDNLYRTITATGDLLLVSATISFE